MKNLISVVMCLLMSTGINELNAQKLWIDGVVFYQQDGACYAVPFATVKYYDARDTSKLVYREFTDLSGRYDFGKDAYSMDYYVTVEAPGFSPRAKYIGNLPPSHEGEFTLHYRLEEDDKSPKVSFVEYDGDFFKKKTPTVGGIFGQLGFSYDGMSVKSADAQNVKLLFNGISLSDRTVISKLMTLSIRYLSEVAVYTLPDSSSYPFCTVINIVIKGQNSALYHQKFNGMPAETRYYDIEKK